MLVTSLILIAALSWWLVARLRDRLVQRDQVDRPNERSLHQGAIPRGGGLVIVAILLTCLLGMGFYSGRVPVFSTLALLTAGWASLSWLDDRHNLSAAVRLMLQAGLSATTLFAFGYITHIEFAVDRELLFGGAGLLITFLGILWFANLYNFMDGMDGLAATQSVIAAITLAFWFWQAGDPQLAFCCLVLAATCYGFLLHNWHPATIFMGDVGSVSLGAFFATMIVFANTRYDIPVLSLVLLFAVFVGDASVTLLRRLWRREKIWQPHRSHYYQRLALLGYSHSQVVIGISILMLLCAMIASITVLEHDRIPLAVTAITALMAIAMLIVHRLEARAGHSADR